MSNVRTSITIAASPDRVWSVLTDFDAYPQWNKIIRDMRTEIRLGATARFKIKIEGNPVLRFTAKVVRCEPGRDFGWRGGAPVIPSLAWGEHYFQLEPAGEGTLLTHGEDFGGVLGLVMRGGVHARVTRTYDAFNLALKARAES